MNAWPEQEPAYNERVVELLNRVFSDRYHSLAQYVIDAQPYVPESEVQSLYAIREIAEYDQVQARRLADLIESLEGIPQVVAPYPHDIAEFNYLALPYLKKVLSEKLIQQAEAYEAFLSQLKACRPAWETVEKIAAELRAHAHSLVTV